MRHGSEAQGLLDQQVEKVRAMSLDELRSLIPRPPKRWLLRRFLAALTRREQLAIYSDPDIPDEVVGPSGTEYHVVTSAHWQDQKGGPIAVFVTVVDIKSDDMDFVTREFAIAPDGSWLEPVGLSEQTLTPAPDPSRDHLRLGVIPIDVRVPSSPVANERCAPTTARIRASSAPWWASVV
jgi:hypothetical protein